MEVFLDPVAVGDRVAGHAPVPHARVYVPVPLEATYRAAWEAVPDFLRDVLTAPPGEWPQETRRGRKRKK